MMTGDCQLPAGTAAWSPTPHDSRRSPHLSCPNNLPSQPKTPLIRRFSAACYGLILHRAEAFLRSNQRGGQLFDLSCGLLRINPAQSRPIFDQQPILRSQALLEVCKTLAVMLEPKNRTFQPR